MFNVSFPSASTAILLLVRFPVAPPLTFNFSPSFLSTSVPLSPPNVIGLFLTAFNCPTLTASSLSVPSSTLVIFLLPASIPVELNLGPLLIVTLLKLTSLLVAIVKSFPAWVISILSPSLNLTVSPPCTFWAVPLLATTFQAAASLAIFCTAVLETVTSYVAFLSPKFCPVEGATVAMLSAAVEATTFSVDVAVAVALFIALFNWPKLTAWSLAVPLATLDIVLPPALIPPVFVIDGPPVIVSPLLFNVESPILTLPFVPRSTFSASLMFNVSFPLASTAILLLVRFPVAPPLTLNLIPPVLSKAWVLVVPVSPPSETVLLARVDTLFILALASGVKSNVMSVPVAVEVR